MVPTKLQARGCGGRRGPGRLASGCCRPAASRRAPGDAGRSAAGRGRAAGATRPRWSTTRPSWWRTACRPARSSSRSRATRSGPALVETVIGGKMRGDLERLVPGATLQMECKTLSCLDGGRRARGQAARWRWRWSRSSCSVPSWSTGPGGGRHPAAAVHHRAAHVRPAGVHRLVPGHPQENLRRRSRPGTRPNPIPLPAEQLPDE